MPTPIPLNTIKKFKLKKEARSPDRELFSVELLTPKRAGGEKQIVTLVVRELLALTFASNRALAKIIQAYRKKLGFDKHLPKELYDQWISRRVHHKAIPNELADQRKRAERCRQLAQGMDSVEHITLRLYAADVLKPQSKKKARAQLLAIAYHHKHQWVHVEALDISQSYLARDTGKKRADHARMLTRSQWQALAQCIRNRAEAEGMGPDTQLTIHAPQGCGLSELLCSEGLITVEDMPSIPAEPVQISYRFKDSKRYLLKQESLAAILSRPTKDDLLSDIEMTELPVLAGLTHAQKDRLIQTLWNKIETLCQPVITADSDISQG